MNSPRIVVNAPVTVREIPLTSLLPRPLIELAELAQQVKWEESNCSFTGVVKVVNNDGSCDVLYDEEVGGKPCMEKNVQAARIRPISATTPTTNLSEDENYWHDSDKEISIPKSAKKRGKRKISEVTEGEEGAHDARKNHANLITRLLQVRSSSRLATGQLKHILKQQYYVLNVRHQLNGGASEDFDEDSLQLTFVDTVALHDALTPQAGAAPSSLRIFTFKFNLCSLFTSPSSCG